jgi:hypothetical protein
MHGHERDRFGDIECGTAAKADHCVGVMRLVGGDAAIDLALDGIAPDLGIDADVELRQVEINVTGAPEIGAGPTPTPASDPQAALRSFERRTEVDRILYENALARTCGSHAQARRFADRAFARQVERFNRITDGAAADLAVALADS